MRKIFTATAVFAVIASTSLVLHAEQTMKYISSSSASSSTSTTKTVDVPSPIVRENPFMDTVTPNSMASQTTKDTTAKTHVDSSKNMATDKKNAVKKEMHKMDSNIKKMGDDTKKDMHKMGDSTKKDTEKMDSGVKKEATKAKDDIKKVGEDTKKDIHKMDSNIKKDMGMDKTN